MTTTQIDLCNRALRRLGTQSTITSLTDNSVEANTCAAFYNDVLTSLLEAPYCSAYPNYAWQWPRRITSGASAASTNPRWRYEYALPSDYVRASGIIDPNAPPNFWQQPDRMFLLRVPYEIGAGTAGGSELVPVIWCNLSSIDLLYVSNGLAIDSWPATFRKAFWLSLAAEMATSLGIDGNTTAAVASEADRALAQACRADQRVEVVTTEYIPDWMQVRFSDPFSCGLPAFDPANQPASGETAFIVGDVATASPTPSYLTPANGLNGVPSMGMDVQDISNRDEQYVAAYVPDSRIGVLAIGVSPVGWRRPYHTTTLNAAASDASGEYDV
ncbi:MAG: hypothetical protein ABF812_12690 [Gluconobacter cerinus]|uniref:hypothetical protein n=1 Tax=Gluconobacter cerinus TaxID=38307 RepID=UPI0039ECAD58